MKKGMRPKSDTDRKIVKLSKSLTWSLTNQQRDYAIRHIFSAGGFYSRKKAWCFDCGTIFPYNGKETAVCPHCGKKIKLTENGKWSHHEPVYYGVMSVVGGYQVLRAFVIDRQSKKGKAPVYVINECYQLWKAKKGNFKIIARNRYGFNSLYYDRWDYWSEMTLKPHGALCYEFGGCIYPHSGIAKWLRKIGFSIGLYQKTSCYYNETVSSRVLGKGRSV